MQHWCHTRKPLSCFVFPWKETLTAPGQQAVWVTSGPVNSWIKPAKASTLAGFLPALEDKDIAALPGLLCYSGPNKIYRLGGGGGGLLTQQKSIFSVFLRLEIQYQIVKGLLPPEFQFTGHHLTVSSHGVPCFLGRLKPPLFRKAPVPLD